MTETRDEQHVDNFLDALSQPEVLAISILWNGEGEANDDDKVQGQDRILVETCKFMFHRIETLGKIYSNAIEGKDPESNPIALSGLESLYTGTDDNDDNNNQSSILDAETIWGQVDLQNVALLASLKRSVKKLSKAAELSNDGKSGEKYKIQLLEDIPSTDDESESDQSDDKSDEDGSNQPASGEEFDNNDSDDDTADSDAKRIQSRMERVMAEMDDEDNDDDDDDNESENDDENGGPLFNQKSKATTKSKHVNDDDSEMDPAAEELNDGFFNILEMEAFADEEEEYLPDDANGTGDNEDSKKKKEKDNRSFHQKQRDGDFDDDDNDDDIENDDDDDEEESDLLFRKENPIRRKAYRDDEDIEALLDIYETPQDDDDIVSEDDPVNMTAADLYGPPNKQRLEKWSRKKQKNKSQSKKDMSWTDEDFDGDKNDEEVGWRDNEGSDDDNEAAAGDNDDDESMKDEENSDEVVPMKGNDTDKKKSTKKAAPTKQLEKIRLQTEQLEEEMLAEKPWQMIGEAGSSSRPVNSLLDSTPEFEVAAKLAPIITVEHTENLEEMIKKRILNEDWDDVIPRELPDVGWHKKKGEIPEVSQEKSKLGLGELYEREYLKKVAGYDVEKKEKETEEEKLTNEMKTLFANL